MRQYDITDFGALPGEAVCTKSIQAALNACRERGGTVIIPAGSFCTGSLEVFSNTTLYLEAGAILKGAPDMKEYPGWGYIHNEMGEVRGLLHAMKQENITVAGEGTLDFSADAFFDYSRSMQPDLAVNELTETQKQEFVVYYKERPNQMMFFRQCSNIRIRDVTLRNAASWGLVLSMCEDIKVQGIRIRFGLRLPNNDGIHITGCKNVLIDGCDIVSGDDCIAVSGIDAWTEENRNIIISNCLLCSSSAAIRFGYWNSRVRNCQVSHCTVYDSNRAVCIMSCGGGYVQNILIDGLFVETRSRAGGWWGMGEAVYIAGHTHDVYTVSTDHGSYEGTLRNVNISDITIRDLTADCENGIILAGDSYNIKNINFYHVSVRIKDSTNRNYFGNRLDLAPGNIVKELETGTVCWLYAEEAENVHFTDLNVENGMKNNGLRVVKSVINCKGLEFCGRIAVL